jgi:beta-N-acetylhexosaminidase
VHVDFSWGRQASEGEMGQFDREAARCVFVGVAGLAPKREELQLIARGVGGVILFSRNVREPSQVAALSKELKQAAKGPLLMCIDQEGGRVQRLRPPFWTAWPSMRRLGEIDDKGGALGLTGPQVAEQVGAMIARELRACGIDLDFAPVVDVDTNPKNPVIADRSFGRDARQVARLGVALAQGLEKAGVASCVKHFPGHGDTATDSHVTLPRLAHDKQRLWEVELVPFVAAARAHLASVMTAHVRFEAFDRLPATLSAVSLSLLRKDVEFEGACLSDDLEMKAISDIWGVPDAAELSIDAGCDAVLVCHTLQHQHDAIDAIARGARSGPLPRERLAQASARIAQLQKFARPAESIDPLAAASACATEEHRRFASDLEDPETIADRLRDPTEHRA